MEQRKSLSIVEKMDKALKESGEVNQGKMQINFKKFFLLKKARLILNGI